MQHIQCRNEIDDVLILTCSNEHTRTHCLLLSSINGMIAIKSGFSSGYGGTGPSCFSFTLKLLKFHRIKIDECEVDENTIDRLDRSALTQSDIENIASARRIRPTRWYDYILERHYEDYDGKTLWWAFEPIIPFAVVDDRIIDLALTFWENPDDKLLTGYRRLEDTIRARTGVEEFGRKLFSTVFNGKEPLLEWSYIDDSEASGRTNLFVGAFGAHRNPRAHKELKSDPVEQLSEFLVLNHLFRLLKESRRSERVVSGSSD